MKPAMQNIFFADLLSQAEHDERATAICITTNIDLAKSRKRDRKAVRNITKKRNCT